MLNIVYHLTGRVHSYTSFIGGVTIIRSDDVHLNFSVIEINGGAHVSVAGGRGLVRGAATVGDGVIYPHFKI